MDGPKYMLVAYKSFHSFIENSDQSIEANGKDSGSLLDHYDAVPTILFLAICF